MRVLAAIERRARAVFDWIAVFSFRILPYVLVCAGIALVVMGLVALAAKAEATPLKTEKITYAFRGPNQGAFGHAKSSWNHIARSTGAPEFTKVKPGERPDLIVTGYDGACSSPNVGRYRMRGGVAYVKVQRCYMANTTIELRRENYTHELGHVIDLRHMGGRTVMREDASDTHDWRPTEKDRRILARIW